MELGALIRIGCSSVSNLSMPIDTPRVAMFERFRDQKLLPMRPLFRHQPIVLMVRCRLLGAGNDSILILIELQRAVSRCPVFGVCSVMRMNRCKTFGDTLVAFGNRCRYRRKILLFFDRQLTVLYHTNMALFVHQLEFTLKSF